MNSASARFLYLGLLAGLLGSMAVFALLFWLGQAPTLEGDPTTTTIIATVIAAMALGPLLLGWFWARPNVPLAQKGGTPDAFWSDERSRSKALLLWVLWEGSGITATVGTMLTRSALTGSVAAIALALLVTHSPAFLESRIS